MSSLLYQLGKRCIWSPLPLAHLHATLLLFPELWNTNWTNEVTSCPGKPHRGFHSNIIICYNSLLIFLSYWVNLMVNSISSADEWLLMCRFAFLKWPTTVPHNARSQLGRQQVTDNSLCTTQCTQSARPSTRNRQLTLEQVARPCCHHSWKPQ